VGGGDTNTKRLKPSHVKKKWMDDWEGIIEIRIFEREDVKAITQRPGGHRDGKFRFDRNPSIEIPKRGKGGGGSQTDRGGSRGGWGGNSEIKIMSGEQSFGGGRPTPSLSRRKETHLQRE